MVNPSESQILQGDWVDASQRQIERHRKTDVTVIVLDQDDQAVQGARVELIQQRHDFVFGLVLPSDRMPPEGASSLPVYRCFNAVALDRYTDWSKPHGDTATEQARRLDAWLTAIDPIRTHFGTVVSADPAKNHDRLSLLSPADLRDAILARIDLAAIYEPAPTDYDLYADVLQQDMIERKLGRGMIHRMFDRAESHKPEASLGLRVRDAINLQRGRDLAKTIQSFEVRQVPLDHITIQQAFVGPIQPHALGRMLDEYVSALPAPVTVTGLEVSGTSTIAASINMETVLRLLFAQPRISGVYLAGLMGSEYLEPKASLLNDQGEPTAVGKVIDEMLTKLWHSHETGQSDERGNVSARVFTGWYDVTATLPDGTTLKSQAYIPKDNRPKLIVLQTTRAESDDDA